MAEHIRSGKHDVRKQPDWNHGKMTEQLSEHLQSQSLDESDNEPKRPMSLLQLPLVLVRQILQDLVQCYATPQNQTVKLLSLLDLRRVHSKSAPCVLLPSVLMYFVQDFSMPK